MSLKQIAHLSLTPCDLLTPCVLAAVKSSCITGLSEATPSMSCVLLAACCGCALATTQMLAPLSSLTWTRRRSRLRWVSQYPLSTSETAASIRQEDAMMGWRKGSACREAASSGCGNCLRIIVTAHAHRRLLHTRARSHAWWQAQAADTWSPVAWTSRSVDSGLHFSCQLLPFFIVV